MLSIRLYVTNSYLKPWIHIQHRKAEEFPKIIEVSLYMLQSGALKMAKLVYNCINYRARVYGSYNYHS